MKEFIDRPQQQRNRVITIILTALFLMFVAFFYIGFQKDFIALMQETWSRGQTTNSAFVTTVIAAVVLILLQRAMRSIFEFRGRWEAVSYIPSFALLALTTAVDFHTMRYNLRPWIVVAIVVVLIFVLVVFLSRLSRSDKKTPLVSLLWPNLVVFVTSAVVCMMLTNHNAAAHQELAAYHYASRDKAEAVSSVARRSLETTPALTALRNVALAKQGLVGDQLFTYPQPYASKGLGVNRYTRVNTHYGANVFYEFFGEEPYGGETPDAFCARLYRQEDTPFHRDLYIASLLLDGKLKEFVQTFPPQAFIAPDASAAERAALPRHYREAWLLAANMPKGANLCDYRDDELQPLLDDFKARYAASHTDVETTMAELYLDYGQTFWHYYFYQDNIAELYR